LPIQEKKVGEPEKEKRRAVCAVFQEESQITSKKKKKGGEKIQPRDAYLAYRGWNGRRGEGEGGTPPLREGSSPLRKGGPRGDGKRKGKRRSSMHRVHFSHKDK